MRERVHLKDLGVDGRMTFRWIFMKWDVEVWDCIELARDRDRRRARVDAVMNLWVP
jgi:hypothetical protein